MLSADYQRTIDQTFAAWKSDIWPSGFGRVTTTTNPRRTTMNLKQEELRTLIATKATDISSCFNPHIEHNFTRGGGAKAWLKEQHERLGELIKELE
jgi:hypothetical protein